MKRTKIIDALNAQAPVDDVRIMGWVRSKRRGFPSWP